MDEDVTMKNWLCNTKCQAFIESSGLLGTLALTNPTIENNVHGFVQEYGTTFMDAHTCKCVILDDHGAPVGGNPYSDLKIAGPNTCQSPFQPVRYQFVMLIKYIFMRRIRADIAAI